MSSDRSQRVSDLYHRALARAPEERAAFLIEACNGDEALRQEVGSLLEFESASARFLETPAASWPRACGTVDSMIDRQIGPYTIVAPLGAGGMGEVYRARDSKLGRDVAIKILPSHFTADPERRARFAREARTLATLNHPHIGAIYGLEESDGIDRAGPRTGRGTDAGRSPRTRPVADSRGARHRAADRRRRSRRRTRKGSSIAI